VKEVRRSSMSVLSAERLVTRSGFVAKRRSDDSEERSRARQKRCHIGSLAAATFTKPSEQRNISYGAMLAGRFPLRERAEPGGRRPSRWRSTAQPDRSAAPPGRRAWGRRSIDRAVRGRARANTAPRPPRRRRTYQR